MLSYLKPLNEVYQINEQNRITLHINADMKPYFGKTVYVKFKQHSPRTGYVVNINDEYGYFYHTLWFEDVVFDNREVEKNV